MKQGQTSDVKEAQKKGKTGFFIRMKQSRGFTVIQGIAVLGVCLGFLALAQTGYRNVVNTSVTNTSTFVQSTAP